MKFVPQMLETLNIKLDGRSCCDYSPKGKGWAAPASQTQEGDRRVPGFRPSPPSCPRALPEPRAPRTLELPPERPTQPGAAERSAPGTPTEAQQVAQGLRADQAWGSRESAHAATGAAWRERVPGTRAAGHRAVFQSRAHRACN